MSNELKQLKHRLAMIQEDQLKLRKFIFDNELDEKFMQPTEVSDEAWTLLNNIEIACDLNSQESITWGSYKSKDLTK